MPGTTGDAAALGQATNVTHACASSWFAHVFSFQLVLSSRVHRAYVLPLSAARCGKIKTAHSFRTPILALPMIVIARAAAVALPAAAQSPVNHALPGFAIKRPFLAGVGAVSGNARSGPQTSDPPRGPVRRARGRRRDHRPRRLCLRGAPSTWTRGSAGLKPYSQPQRRCCAHASSAALPQWCSFLSAGSGTQSTQHARARASRRACASSRSRRMSRLSTRTYGARDTEKCIHLQNAQKENEENRASLVRRKLL